MDVYNLLAEDDRIRARGERVERCRNRTLYGVLERDHAIFDGSGFDGIEHAHERGAWHILDIAQTHAVRKPVCRLVAIRAFGAEICDALKHGMTSFEWILPPCAS